MALHVERRGPVVVAQGPPTEDASRRPGRRAIVTLTLATIVAVAVALRLWGLTRQGLWFDEAMTGWLLRLPVGRMLDTIPATESTPPLYYLVAWGWVHAFGDGMVGLRSLSVLAGVLTVPVTFAAGRTIAGARAGLAAAAIVAVDPMLIWYAQEARAYALLVLLSAVTLWLAARARHQPTPARLAVWALAAAAAIWTHYFAVFLVGPQALWLVLRREGIRIGPLAAAAVSALLALPLRGMVHEQRHHARLFQRVPLQIRTHQIGMGLFAGFHPPTPTKLGWAMSATIAVLILVAIVLGTRAQRRAALAAAAIGIAAIGVPWLLALAGTDVLDARNVIGAVVPLAVAAGIGLAVRPLRGAGALVLAAVAIASVGQLVAMARDIPAQKPHWHEVAKALEGRMPHAIYLAGGPSWHLPLSFVLPDTWWLPKRGAWVQQLDVLRRVSHLRCPRGTFWGASCDMNPHPIPKKLPGHGWHLVRRQRIAGYEVDVFRARSPVLVHQVRSHGRRHKRRIMLQPTRVPIVP